VLRESLDVTLHHLLRWDIEILSSMSPNRNPKFVRNFTLDYFLLIPLVPSLVGITRDEESFVIVEIFPFLFLQMIFQYIYFESHVFHTPRKIRHVSCIFNDNTYPIELRNYSVDVEVLTFFCFFRLS
jgi:hypothetical protein